MRDAELHQLLGQNRFSIGSETTVQREVATVLRAAGLPFEKEYRLDQSNRIDFLVGGTGIEIKVKGGRRDILRQVRRYCEFDEIKSLVLLSGVAIGMPPTIQGKPVTVMSLGAAWI